MVIPKRRISVLNQKGGVGKSTTTVNVAVAAARLGARVLVVDFDAQRNASQFLGVPDDYSGWGSAELVLSTAPFAPLRSQCVPGLDVVAATRQLVGLERHLLGDLVSGPKRLKRALERTAGDYDVILVDCGPTLGMMALNAVVACPEVLVPVELGHAAVVGAITLQHFLEDVRIDLEPRVRLLGVLPTFLDDRESTPKIVLALLKDIFGSTVFTTAIHTSAALRDSAGKGRPLVLDEPESRGAQEYQSLTMEVFNRGIS